MSQFITAAEARTNVAKFKNSIEKANILIDQFGEMIRISSENGHSACWTLLSEDFFFTPVFKAIKDAYEPDGFKVDAIEGTKGTDIIVSW